MPEKQGCLYNQVEVIAVAPPDVRDAVAILAQVLAELPQRVSVLETQVEAHEKDIGELNADVRRLSSRLPWGVTLAISLLTFAVGSLFTWVSILRAGR